jgi:hypothetical protein
MPQAEIPMLKKRVSEVARRSAIGKRLKDVVLEADRDEEGSDFLRVVVQVKTLDSVRDEDLEELIRSIENALSDLDERFPSVRFADAA